MTQLDAIKQMDADLHAAFADAGLADSGHYTAPGANFDTPVAIYIDRAVQVMGEFGQLVGRRTEIGIVHGAVTPAQKGRVYVPDEPATYELGDKLTDDGSLSRWVVRRV